jgi:hypothetical protein
LQLFFKIMIVIIKSAVRTIFVIVVRPLVVMEQPC